MSARGQWLGLRAQRRTEWSTWLMPLGALPTGRLDVIAGLAEPLPCIVTAEMLGVPVEHFQLLKAWSQDFAEMLGNFQHNPDHAPRIAKSVEAMTEYFRSAIAEQRRQPHPGLLSALMNAEVDGDRLSDVEIIANVIVTMVGGQETTTNLIGNGLLSLLRNPSELERLRGETSLIPSAIEELLRYESPSQQTARLAPNDLELGGKAIRQRQAVIAVMGAAGTQNGSRSRIGSISRDATIATSRLAGGRTSVLAQR